MRQMAVSATIAVTRRLSAVVSRTDIVVMAVRDGSLGMIVDGNDGV
jgi:hypothetical protein